MGVSNHFQLTQNACFDELIPIGVDELIPIGVDELIPMDVSDLFSRPFNMPTIFSGFAAAGLHCQRHPGGLWFLGTSGGTNQTIF
jgi:hypothetical protein